MKLKKSNAGKVLTVSLLLIGIGFASCKKEVDTTPNSEEKRGIETWKTLEDYPSEITVDNWKEFVYAPKEVIAHFEEMERLNSCSNNTTKSLTPTQGDGSAAPPSAFTGLVQFYQGGTESPGLIHFPGVSVSNCLDIFITNNIPGSPVNYLLLGSCTTDPNICMVVDQPGISTSQWCDLTEPLAGVTTLDIVLIQKHILGLEVFTETAQYLAADVNRDGKINGVDIVVSRKLLLGFTSDWPTGVDNYLFIDNTDYANFDPSSNTDLNNYGQTAPCQNLSSINRIGVKTGDVNGSLSNCF